MTGYTLNLTCPRCGGPLDHQAGGTTDGWQTRAVVRCAPCGDQLVIEVRISSGKRHAAAQRDTAA